MALNSYVFKFIKNPFSLDNIIALGKYLQTLNLGMLYLEVEDLLAETDNELTIKSYANILFASTRVNSMNIEYYLKLTRNLNKQYIIKQINLINSYKGGRPPVELYLYIFHKCLIKRNMKELIDTLGMYPEILDDHIIDMEIHIYIDYLVSLKRSSVSLYRVLVKNNLHNRFSDDIARLYDNFDSKQQDRVIDITPDFIMKDLSLDSLIKNLDRMSNLSDAYVKIRRRLLELSDDKAAFEFMKLLNHIKDGFAYRFIDYIDKLRDIFPECPLLDLYISNLAERPMLYYSSYEDNEEAVSLDNYFNFFTIDAKAEAVVGGSGPMVNKTYTLLDLCDNELIRYVIRGDSPSRYEYINRVDKGYSKATALLIADYADHNLYSFMAMVSECRKSIELYNEKALDNALLDAFSKIENGKMISITESLADNMKVGLEYHFELSDKENLLSFRIGNNKTYSVASAGKMLDLFNTEGRFRYGKDLTFTHKIDNLNEEDIEPIGYLKSLNPSNYKKHLRLNDSSLIHLFNLLKNRGVYIDEVAYILRLDEAKAKFKMDNDYKISFNMTYDKIIPCFNKYIAIDSKNHYVDFINQEDKPLIDFVIKFKDKSLKRVKKDFIERIYPLYSNLIEVNSDIKDEFNVSSLEIDSYFDFNSEDKIDVRISYSKNGCAISLDELKSSSDLIKAMKLKEILLGFGFNDSGVILNDDDIISFLKADLSGLKEYSNVYLSDAITNKQILTFHSPKVKMQYDNDLLKVFMKDSIYSDEELYQILLAIKKKRKFVLLKNDRIIDLDTTSAEEFLDVVDDFNLDAKHLKEEVDKPLYQTLLAFKHLASVELDSYLSKLVDDIKGFKDHKFTLPKLNAELREYQIEGFSWLKILSGYHLGGILADDMGLGKTLEIITLLSSDESSMPSLIVSPKSLIFNWISEFNRFNSSYEIIPIYGTQMAREAIINNIDSNKRVCYITSYDSLRNDSMLYKMEFNYLVLDEAQYIKNALALTTKAVKKIKSINRFALTGTPIENDIFDLWSIFDFLMPDYLPSIAKFKKSGTSPDFQDIIKRRVAPFILRRTKENVLTELPEKFTRVISADMTEGQRKLYDAHCKNARSILEAGGDSFDVLHLLTRLRQICVDPRTFVDDYNEKSGKILLLREMLPLYINDGHRILIFSQFVKALNYISLELNDLGIKHLILTGDTKAEDRIRLVNEFNKNDSIKVFLISLKAGGNGLNLVGADTVIHMDPWWNLASENQATDRAYRMGQKRNVEVIRLIVSDSIEQRVVELQYKKKDLIDKLISNDTKAIERISLDDMKFILE